MINIRKLFDHIPDTSYVMTLLDDNTSLAILIDDINKTLIEYPTLHTAVIKPIDEQTIGWELKYILSELPIEHYLPILSRYLGLQKEQELKNKDSKNLTNTIEEAIIEDVTTDKTLSDKDILNFELWIAKVVVFAIVLLFFFIVGELIMVSYTPTDRGIVSTIASIAIYLIKVVFEK